MRSSPNAEREHQDRPITLDENDAAELGAVVRDETNAARRLRRIGDPCGHGTETRTALVDSSK